MEEAKKTMIPLHSRCNQEGLGNLAKLATTYMYARARRFDACLPSTGLILNLPINYRLHCRYTILNWIYFKQPFTLPFWRKNSLVLHLTCWRNKGNDMIEVRLNSSHIMDSEICRIETKP